MLCLPRPARVRHGVAGWQTPADGDTVDSGLSLHVVSLPSASLSPGSSIDFTFYWTDDARWDGHAYRVDVV